MFVLNFIFSIIKLYTDLKYIHNQEIKPQYAIHTYTCTYKRKGKREKGKVKK